MLKLLDLIRKLYGSKIFSKTLGTRTNVIKLPSKEKKRLAQNDFDIDRASDEQAKILFEEGKELVEDLPKLNDMEKMTLEANLRRLARRMGMEEGVEESSAEVFDIGTKQPVSPAGIKQLAAEQETPLMKKLAERAADLRRPGGGLDPVTGLTRTVAREILSKNKIKIEKGEDPIELFRKNFGQDVLGDISNLAEELVEMDKMGKVPKRLEKILEQEGLLDLKPRKDAPQGYSDGELMKMLKEGPLGSKIIPADSPEGKKITEALLGKPKGPKASVTKLLTADKIIADINKMEPIEGMKEVNKVIKKEGKYKNVKDEDVKRIFDETQDAIFERDVPVDEFASGGRVGFAEGTKMASGPDIEDSRNELSLELFGKPIDLLTPEEMDMLNEEAERLTSKYMANGGRVTKAGGGLAYLMGL